MEFIKLYFGSNWVVVLIVFW